MTETTIHKTKLGSQSIEADHVITFPQGILGFPDVRHFAIMEEDLGTPLFRWLQALDDPEVAFVVVDPSILVPDYRKTIRPEDLNNASPILPDVGDTGEEDRSKRLILLVILNVPKEDPMKMTANLLGPLVINPVTRTAMQIILSESGYSSEHPLFDLVVSKIR